MMNSPGMRPHRVAVVVLAIEPGLRHDIVRSTLEGHADMRVVPAEVAPAEVTHQVQTLGADALVIEGKDADQVPDYCLRLLAESPALIVVIIDPALRTASVVSTRPTRSRYHDVSISMLAEQIRARLDASQRATALIEVPE
jgi:hypothetical protein